VTFLGPRGGTGTVLIPVCTVQLYSVQVQAIAFVLSVQVRSMYLYLLVRYFVPGTAKQLSSRSTNKYEIRVLVPYLVPVYITTI
jgi:hypothetical protein